ncbi:hypothetical protein ACFL27_20495 [candidate division CSSED10-310 bacterium]|uniref:DUF4268 domain-containing protein n=1 Tax=candidate division CSSED10-310 bacterium TaxID=2855610 RepID=A0ABV6Z2F3_UNCC1
MSRADRKKRRQQRLAMEWQAQYDKAMTGIRRIGEDASWPGGGVITVQISKIPSFAPGYVWDFREFEESLTLYVSYTDLERGGYFKPGYHKLSAKQDFLRSLIESITRFDIKMRFVGQFGLDGTDYSVRFRSDFSEASLRWWEDGPEAWRPFISQVFEVIEVLESITNQ